MRFSVPVFAAIAAGLFAMGFAFVSSPAGADDKTHAENAKRLSTVIFAGGCFWCVEADFDKIEGVHDTVSGYTGGALNNPSYKQVTYGGTGHYEAVKVSYDAEAVSFEELTNYFFRHIDPTDDRGQFCDKGESYLSAIFVKTDAERDIVEAEIEAIESSAILPSHVVTKVLEASMFWPAETYHQNYYKKNPLRYRFYRNGCGRDKRIKALWGSEVGH